ncbi:MAG: hypothetical protein H0U87_04195 [Acidobacteria bacterium]|nr:hypothetical protein [Acidobacteriota bacterium]
MKKVLFFILVLILSVSAIFAQTAPQQNSATTANFDLKNYGVSVEPDKRVIAVLASLEAAGIETPLTAKGEKFRALLKTDLQSLSPELRQKIKIFLDRYAARFAEKYQQNLSDERKKDFAAFLQKYKNGFASEGERKIYGERYKSFYAGFVSPFVSMAYSLSPTPDLSDPARTSDLPGDLLEILDYAPLTREFYGLVTAAKIDEYAKIYQTENNDLKSSATKMVTELLDYLHTKPQLTYLERIKTEVAPTRAKNKKQNAQKTEIRERARRFFIVPEMLAPKASINFLNIGDDYFAVVPPETNLSQSDVRRAYLQFTLDPLALNNAKGIQMFSEPIKKLLADLRQTLFEREKAKNKNARLEDVGISPDPFLAVSRSLVAAADARQTEFQKTQIAISQARRSIDAMKTDAEKRKVSAQLDIDKRSLSDETALQLSEAYEKGAVLAFYFADQLKGAENSGFDIASSFREMILSLDTAKEVNRYAQFADARQRAIAARAVRRSAGNSEIAAIENPTTKKLLDIEKIIQAKNYPQAETQLKQLLDANPDEAARIYYALGRNASLSAETIKDIDVRNRRLLEAKVAYENVIDKATEDLKILTTKNLASSASADSDRALISLSYVALGRIYEYDDENDYAVKIYEAAIKIGDVPEGAYKEAVAARDRLLKKP